MMTRTYSELITLPTFEERFAYLKLDGVVGEESFGSARYLNQQFYHSPEWKCLRDRIILRDNGCDLGVIGFEIYGRIYIHHINPISPEDIRTRSRLLMSPENLICVSFETHNALHYGDPDILPKSGVIERSPNDTCPWRR